MNRYELKGQIRDLRQLGSFITTELLQLLEHGKNYVVEERGSNTIVRYVGPLFFITPEIENYLRRMIMSNDGDRFEEHVGKVVDEFCNQTLRIILSYVRVDLSAKWYSPFMLWKVFERYFLSGSVNGDALEDALTLEFDSNEIDVFLDSELDLVNAGTVAGNKMSMTTKSVTYLTNGGYGLSKARIDDVNYWNEWFGNQKVTGLYAIHWYDSFNRPHVHRFPDETNCRRFILWCLYRTWREQIRMTKADTTASFRRLTYMPAWSNRMVWNYEGQNLINILYVLAALPVPTSDIRVIPQFEDEFIAYCLTVYDNYTNTLGTLGVITATGQQILVADWQLEVMQNSGLLTDEKRVRLIAYPSTLVIAGIEHDQLFTGQNGPLIEYPQGESFEYQIVTRPALVNPELLKRQTMREDIVMLVSAYPLTANLFTGGPAIDETTLLNVYSATWGIRKVFSDIMTNLLNPIEFSKLNIQTEFGEGVRFDDGLKINGYLYDSPTNYSLTNPIDGELRLGLPGSVLSTKWNSSTVKLLSVLISGLRISRDDVEMYDVLTSQRSVVILGATDEPLVQKIANITRGNWSATAIGDNARYPNKTSTFEGLMYTGSADIWISDMNFDSTLTSTLERVVAYNEWVVRNISTMLQNRPTLVIYKLQWPTPSMVAPLLAAIPAVYGVYFFSCGGSPTLSEELFLVLTTRSNLRSGALELEEYIQRLSLQEIHYEVNNIKQVSLTTDLDEENVAPGDYFIMTGTKSEAPILLSIASNLSSWVIGGLQATNMGVTAHVHGFIDIVRLELLNRRHSYRRSVNAIGRPRAFAGSLPLSMREPKMQPLDAIRAFQHIMSYHAGRIMFGTGNNVPLVALGGGQFTEVWWNSVEFHIYDRNLTYNPQVANVFLHNVEVTDANLAEILLERNANFAAINSIMMRQGDTHVALLARLKTLIDYVQVSRRSGVTTLYRGDLTASMLLPAIERFGTGYEDLDGNAFFTFGKYNPVPMLSPEQGYEIYLYAAAAGVDLIELRVPSLFGGAIGTQYGGMINGSFLTTAHQFSLVHVYVFMRPSV